MTNHVHSACDAAQGAAVPKLIISLGRRYVPIHQPQLPSHGYAVDSRYKSSSVQAEPYFLLCQRYIELNPVRAAM